MTENNALNTNIDKIAEADLSNLAILLFKTAKKKKLLNETQIKDLEPLIRKLHFPQLDSLYLRLPRWLTSDWQMVSSVATDIQDKHTFDLSDQGYGGTIETCVKITEGEGLAPTGILIVSWKSTFYSKFGWNILILNQSNILYEGKIGMDSKGVIILTTNRLGFDPLRTPFQYSIYPNNSNSL